MSLNPSFSSTVKSELCKIKAGDIQLIKAELYGMLLFSKNSASNPIVIKTEHMDVSKRFLKLVYKLTKKNYDIINIERNIKSGNPLYQISIMDKPDYTEIWKKLEPFNKGLTCVLENAQLKSPFVRGVFLVCGTVLDPNKEYRLEFSTPYKPLADELGNILENDKQIKVVLSVTKRRSLYVCYIKDSETITEFLAFIGAVVASMDFIQIKMMKELRNNINRTTNFETANIEKTANAAANQLNAIKKIADEKGLDFLPIKLRELAYLRLKNPQLSLSELGMLLKVPISRSGVNHRIQKIMKISENLTLDNINE